jgi:hypothetical protein
MRNVLTGLAIPSAFSHRKSVTSVLAIIVWLMPNCLSFASGDPLESWARSAIVMPTNGLASNTAWNDVTYGNDMFVAVGKPGAILTSTDGRTWEAHNIPQSQELFGVTYGNGTFVAVGGGIIRGRSILSSTNGREWTSRFEAKTSRLQSVAYGNGVFVAVGLVKDLAATLTIVSSPDGITWTHRFSRTANEYSIKSDIVFAEGTFVITGLSIYVSNDGIVWTPVTSPPCEDIVYGNGIFMTKSAGNYLVSDDARAWKVASNSPKLRHALGFGAGRFVRSGFGSIERSSGSVEWSSDGMSWNEHLLEASFAAVAFGAGRFVGVAIGNQFWHSAAVGRFQSEAITLTASGIQLPFDMPVGSHFEVTVSTNLQSWTPLAIITNRADAAGFTDQRNSEFRQRFYRAKLVSP